MKRTRLLTAAAVGLIVVAVTGAAVAATGVLSPKQEREAFLNDAAKELGVEPSDLSAALKSALKKRVDAAVEAGRITKAEGDRIKARIDAGNAPLLFGFGGPRFGPRPGFRHHDREFEHRRGPSLDAAASYLGLTVAKLRTALEGGKTLAQVAKDRGKSVDGLVQAMLADKTKDLDDAVDDGRLTKAERDDLVAGLKQRVTDLVNGRFPSHRHPEFRDRRGAALFFPTA
jgi:polyhydroxyalkanoate synthesis regulator phasin